MVHGAICEAGMDILKADDKSNLALAKDIIGRVKKILEETLADLEKGE